jgi:hypothetical protein
MQNLKRKKRQELIRVAEMREEHKNIQKEIKERYNQKYDVCIEVDGTNYLPDKKSHAYQPDIVIKRRNSNEILFIIEVENDPMRKNLVGASILADYSMSQLKQIEKPTLIFVVYTDEGKKQMKAFIGKLRIAKEYCKNLEDIKIFHKDDFKKEDLSRSQNPN